MSERLLYVALDHNESSPNLSLAERLSEVGGNFGYKVNLDHYTLWGLPYIKELQGQGKPLFVDLKLNNGPRTMTNTIRPLAEAGVNHTSVWAHAERLITPTVEALRDIEGSQLKVLGVTVTSRFDEEYCKKNYGRSLDQTVRHFTTIALDVGCDGVILPGTSLPAIQDIDTVKLVSGVRPVSLGGDLRHQREVITPTQAINNGADILVCGSPIYKASDPVEALESILSNIANA
jgi:orotidine-5'-phosphate decarboxylase